MELWVEHFTECKPPLASIKQLEQADTQYTMYDTLIQCGTSRAATNIDFQY